eukprot:TRINITY_DN3543_c0_g1_i7.p1 TRINITY_DN3543_c0_g1~~TRINITY_DN3543_c0_g1_i7.p1  ORF type:complete len:529 (+),score=87.79 TRINITY_DN3543_c0_g1_i7:416-2002(+)
MELAQKSKIFESFDIDPSTGLIKDGSKKGSRANVTSNLIEHNLDKYGDFVKKWKKYYTKEEYPYWHNASLKRSVWDEPTFILVCLLENKFDIKSNIQYWDDVQNTEDIIVIFDDNTSIIIDRETHAIRTNISEDLMKRYSLVKRPEPKVVPVQEAWKEKYKNEIKAFKELLQERNISKGSVWERELPELIIDFRFTKLPQEYRKLIFKEVTGDSNSSREKNQGSASLPKNEIFKSNEKSITKGEASKQESNDKLKHEETADDESANYQAFKKFLMNFLQGKVEPDTKWKHAKRQLKKEKEWKLLKNKSEKELIFDDVKKQLLSKGVEVAKKQLQEKVEDKNNFDALLSHDPKAVEELQTLYRERLKNLTASWGQVKELLKYDPKFSNSDLSIDLKKKVYEKYVEQRRQLTQKSFEDFLRENASLVEKGSFEELKSLRGDDIRFKSIPDDKSQTLFAKIKDEITKAVDEFVGYLESSTKLLSQEDVKEQDLQHIKSILSTDPRYHVLDSYAELRDTKLKAFIQLMNKAQ